jgi:hypothetical protein
MRPRPLSRRQRRFRLLVLVLVNIVSAGAIAFFLFRKKPESSPTTGTNRVKVYLNSPAVAGWNEIDAVGLIGLDGSTQWAISVEASSSYAIGALRPNFDELRFTEGIQHLSSFAFPHGRVQSSYYFSYGSGSFAGANWGVEQAAGPPDTQGYGDIVTAWASASPDSQREWLILTYENHVIPAAVEIHETYNPGAVDKVTYFTADGEEVVAWEGQAAASPPIVGRRTFRVPIKSSATTE